MDRILEVNEKSRYVVLEAAVSQGKLKSYLEQNHSTLQHSMPEAPPSATVIGNALEHGLGHLSPLYGFHSGMLNGLEVVLPTGETCRIGSCSLSPDWFSGGAPLPDLTGLFAGWFGTTGIVTKAGFRLYPKPKLRDVLVFITENPKLIPKVILRITSTWAPEHITFGQPGPGFYRVKIWITGNSEEEMELKKALLQEILKEYLQNGQGEFIDTEPVTKEDFLRLPPRDGAAIADALKGGGLEYTAAAIPIEKFPEACQRMDEITAKHNLEVSGVGGECIGRAHLVIFFWEFPFNRADSDYLQRVRQALRDANCVAMEIGGIPWKPGLHGQQLIMKKMETNTLNLMMKIKELMDPNHIMNPGNWEVSNGS
jgi:glycolate oxidase